MRQITHKDFDKVYEIYMDKTVNPFMSYDVMNKTDFKKLFKELISRDHFWLFEYEGNEVGMCSVELGKGRVAHSATILSLGIKEDYQGKGFGKIIIRKVIDFLRDKDIARIALGAEADNERGLAFYKKLGFKTEGILKNYLKRGDESHYTDEVLLALVFD